MKFKSNVLSVYLYLPRGSTTSCWGHTLYCFCCSYGRFLRIILLVTAYRTLLKTQECSSCSTEIIISLSAVGFSFCASASVAGESRRIHIPSSPHQRREPRLLPWLWQGAGATRGAGFLPSPPKISFPAWMGGFKGLRADTASAPSIGWGCWSRGWDTNTRAVGVWKPGGSLSTLHRCGRSERWFCAAVGPGARRLENRRGALLCLTKSWIWPWIPLPAPSLLCAIKPCISLKVNY